MRNSYISTKDVASIEDSFFSTNQINEIRKKTPVSEIETKEVDGHKFKSVKGSFVKRKLNIIFGFGWNFQIISNEYYKPSNECIVHGRLTIKTKKGEIIKDQFGSHFPSTKQEASTSAINLGWGYKSAGTDALKKCASEIGICWDIYEQPRPEKKAQKKAKHDTVYQKLEAFLSQCNTEDEIQSIVNEFESNTTIKEEHDLLIQTHMQRVCDINNEFES